MDRPRSAVRGVIAPQVAPAHLGRRAGRTRILADMSGTGHDLVIIGGNAAGLSLAISAQRAGIRRVRIVESTSAVVFPDLVGEHQLDVGYGEEVRSIDVARPTDDAQRLEVTTSKHTYVASAVVVARRGRQPRVDAADQNDHRAHAFSSMRCPTPRPTRTFWWWGSPITRSRWPRRSPTQAPAWSWRPVGMDPTKLSPAGDNWLRRLERERRATLLYRSLPDAIELADGYPMALLRRSENTRPAVRPRRVRVRAGHPRTGRREHVERRGDVGSCLVHRYVRRRDRRTRRHRPDGESGPTSPRSSPGSRWLLRHRRTCVAATPR